MKTYFSVGSIDVERFAQMCMGKMICHEQKSLEITGVCTDSREADENTVFCAFRGANVDGHDYIGAAIWQGCKVVLCEEFREEIANAGAVAIIVKSTEEALSTLAREYSSLLKSKTVAVTGSVGKTTTKDMIASVLSAKYSAFKTKGNFNSVIGMPLSMLEIPNDCDYSVLEMGMSGYGEIERLSNTASPDVAIITTIGTSHMEMLGSRENICRAKLEILCGLKKGGVLMLNGDEPLLKNVFGKSYTTVYVSTERENADVFAKNIRVNADMTCFDLVYQGETVCDLAVRVVGRHNVYSAMFAYAVGRLFGMTNEEIREGLLRFAPEHMRQNIVKIGEITVMEDCYNASPESMKAAIDVLDAYTKLSGGRGVAFLGDMLELGEERYALHREVGAHLAKHKIEKLITVGKLGSFIGVGAKQNGMRSADIVGFQNANDVETIGAYLKSNLQKNDVVLFKASRGMRVERFIEYLKDHL